MLKKPLLFDITSPYSTFEAWFYDTFIAPALLQFKDTLGEDLLDELPENARLLDVGCGGGQALRYLGNQRNDLSLFGLDLSLDQVRRTRKRTGEISDRSFPVQGSALDLPFHDDTFDGLISIASVKHWPNPIRGLEECIRVIKPGGRFLIVEADRGSSLDDARRFVSEFRFPGFITPILARAFKKFVAGQALTKQDAGRLFSNLPIQGVSVESIENLPGLKIIGEK